MNGRETSNLEYKSEVSNTFLKTVSAFANYGDGVILFGVRDDGKTLGIKNPVSTALEIENKINDSIKPSPRYHLKIDEKNLTIELSVFEGLEKPYMYKNKAYKRSDSSTIEVDRTELTRLILEGKNQNFEALPSKEQDLKFDTLEAKLIQELQISSLNLDILKTLNLYTDKTGYNIAAELLSDHNSFLGLDIVKFGKNIDEILDREILDQRSLLLLIDQALKKFKQYYSSEIIEGLKRERHFTIPEKAFREALANAIVHRTWDVPASIRLSMFNDRIEIVSPGGLPAGISSEEYLTGQISILRNPILGNIFFRLNYIEMFGTGIRRINLAYVDSITKPEYKIFPNSISVILPVITQDLSWLSLDELKVYTFLTSGLLYTRTEISNGTDLAKDKLIRTLNQLIEKNVIERTGKGRGTQYKKL